MAKPEKHVLVCTHSRPEGDPKGCCADHGAGKVAELFAKEFGERELWGRFKLNTTSCLGTCEFGGSVLVYPESVMYKQVTVEDVATIIDQHLLGGEPVEALKAPAEVW